MQQLIALIKTIDPDFSTNLSENKFKNRTEETNVLAIHGGKPVRHSLLTYGRQYITNEDIAAVVSVLRSDWLTTGPKVEQFEKAFAETCGVQEAVAVNSGTAALHMAVASLRVKPGDEVIVSVNTFVATANAVIHAGATPIFADVEPQTLLINPKDVERKISPRTKGIIAVDYGGSPCQYLELQAIAKQRGLFLIADSCHSLGASYGGSPVGSLADASAFSFHPVKHITTGEGGMVTTNNHDLALRMRNFRSHGITTDFRERQKLDSWLYEMTELGYNYRLTDFQSALGLSQLKKLTGWVTRRQEIASHYQQNFASIPEVQPLTIPAYASSSYHLYVIQLELQRLHASRADIFRALRAEGIGVNVHYIPVYNHPYYQKIIDSKSSFCPVFESAYEKIITLPIFPTMTNFDANNVCVAVRKVINAFRI